MHGFTEFWDCGKLLCAYAACKRAKGVDVRQRARVRARV